MGEADAPNTAAVCGCWQCFARKPRRQQRTGTAASAPAAFAGRGESLQQERVIEQRRVHSANPPAGPTGGPGTSAKNHRYVSLDLWLPARTSRSGKEQPPVHVATDQPLINPALQPELQLKEAESGCKPGPSSPTTAPTPLEYARGHTSISAALVQPDLSRVLRTSFRNAASCPDMKSLIDSVVANDTAQGNRDRQPSTWVASAKQTIASANELPNVRRSSTGSVETTARAALLLGPAIACKLAVALGPELFALLVSGLGTDIALSGVLKQMSPGQLPTRFPSTPIYVGGRAGVNVTQLRAAAITHVVRSMGPSSTAAMVDACSPGLITEIVKELRPQVTSIILQQLGIRLVGQTCGALGPDKLSGQLHAFGLQLTLGILQALGPDWVGELIREGLGPALTLDLMRKLGPQMVSSIIQGFGNDFMSGMVGCIGNKTMADITVGLLQR